MMPFSVFSVNKRLLMLINDAFPWNYCVGELTIERTNDGETKFYTNQSTEHTIGAFFPCETIEEAEIVARLGVMVIDADKVLNSMELEHQEMVAEDVEKGIDRNLLVLEIIGRIWCWLDDPKSVGCLPLKMYCPNIPVKPLADNS